MPQRHRTVQGKPQTQDRFLLEDAHGKRQLDGAGMTPLWHQVPKNSHPSPELPPQGWDPRATSIFLGKAFLL